MPEFKYGDRVLVEGICQYSGGPDGDGELLVQFGRHIAGNEDIYVKAENVTLAPARPAKVDDQVTAENVAGLPVGSIIRDQDKWVFERQDKDVWVRTGTTTVYEDDTVVSYESVVVFLPEVDA